MRLIPLLRGRRGAFTLLEAIIVGALSVVLLTAMTLLFISGFQFSKSRTEAAADYAERRTFASWAQGRLPFAQLPLRQAYGNQMEVQLSWQGEVKYVLIWADCDDHVIRYAERTQAQGPFAGSFPPPPGAPPPPPPDSESRVFAPLSEEKCPGEGGTPNLFAYARGDGATILPLETGTGSSARATRDLRLAGTRVLLTEYFLPRGERFSMRQGLGIETSPGDLTAIENGSFEEGGDYWTDGGTGTSDAVISSDQAQTGTKSLYLTSGTDAGDQATFTSNVFFSQGDPLQVWIRPDRASSVCAIRILDGDGTQLRQITLPALSPTRWTRVDVTMSTDVGQARRLQFSAGDQVLETAGCYFDTAVASGEAIGGFRPSDFANLGLWLRADAPVASLGATSGEQMGVWEDASTAGRDATNPNDHVLAGVAGSTEGPYDSTTTDTTSVTWSAAAVGLVSAGQRSINTLVRVGETVYAGTEGGLFSSADDGATWSGTTITSAVNDLVATASGDRLAVATDAGVYASTDSGVSWSTRTSGGLGAVTVTAVDIVDGYLFAGTETGIYRTPGPGWSSWTQLEGGLPNGGDVAVRDIVHRANSALLIALDDGTASSDDGVWVSSTQGNSWSAGTTGLTSDALRVRTLLVSGNVVLAGTAAGVFRSTNGGSAWSASSTGLTSGQTPDQRDVRVLASQSGRVWAGTAAGAYVSANAGASWVRKSGNLPSGPVVALVGSCTTCPTLLTTSNDFSSQPVFRFNGDFLHLRPSAGSTTSYANLFNGQGSVTMFVVAKSNAPASPATVFALDDNPAMRAMAFYFNADGTLVWAYGGGPSTLRNILTNSNAATGNTQVYAMRANSAGNAEERRLAIWRNGVAQSANGTADDAAVVNAGDRAPAIGTAFTDLTGTASQTPALNGDIAEIIVYQRALSDAERQEVEAYLGARYGVGVTNE